MKINFEIDEDLKFYKIDKEIKQIKEAFNSVFEKAGYIGFIDFFNDLKNTINTDEVLEEFVVVAKTSGKN